MAASTTTRLDPFDEDFLRRLDQLHLLAKRLAGGRASGVHRSRAVGDGLEFADHRGYAPGDDVRFIDWPYYARMEKLLLRMFHEHSESDVAVLLDASASMAAGGSATFVYARRVAAALAYVGMGSGRRVVLQPFAEELRPSLRTPRHRDAIGEVLGFLAGQPARGQTDLGACASHFAAKVGQCDAVVLISDLRRCGAELSDALARLGGRGRQLSVLHVYAPETARPDLAGALQLHDAESGEEMLVDASADLMASYREQWRQWTDDLEHACRRRRAAYVAAATDVPFERLLLTTLRRAGVLA